MRKGSHHRKERRLADVEAAAGNRSGHRRTGRQTAEIDVVVSDVDMPRMNGFELTSRIRAQPNLAELPVVLVTALEDRADKERGIRVGANAYVLKSGFNQANLLEIVRRIT